VARRFRIVFWLVTWFGALPSLVSGLLLLGHYRIATLCAAERTSVGLDQLRSRVRLVRLHEWGRVGALVAGLLVIAYSVAWAFETPLGRRWRLLVTFFAAGVLLPSLALATWTGRVTPWHALEPPISAGESAQVVTTPEEWGGRQFCLLHLGEVRRLRLVYWLHVAAGVLAVLLTLAMTDLGARWRAAKDAARQSG
jgi:branched-subunit amino acid ABC-type transport system permease component